MILKFSGQTIASIYKQKDCPEVGGVEEVGARPQCQAEDTEEHISEFPEIFEWCVFVSFI